MGSHGRQSSGLGVLARKPHATYVCGSNLGTWLREVTSNEITPQLRVRNQLHGALGRKEVPRCLGKQPRIRPPPLSTQLARPPRGAGQRDPGLRRVPETFGPGPSPRSRGTSGQSPPSSPPGTPRTRRAFPGSGAPRAGGGAEARTQPGAAPGEGAGGPGAQRAARGGRRPTAAAAACSACARPGTRSLQLTPPAARGLPLPPRGEPGAAQVPNDD